MKTTLTVEIDYDPAMTDPEGLACAMDRLLETALSTPGILDEYGNPKVGEFFVAKETAPPAPKVVLNISGGVLQDVFGSDPAITVVLVRLGHGRFRSVGGRHRRDSRWARRHATGGGGRIPGIAIDGPGGHRNRSGAESGRAGVDATRRPNRGAPLGAL